MKLHELTSPAENRKKGKRVGRGQGSGRGEQSGRGHNGQKSRGGASIPSWFEGGQMPLQRRIPKFGFKNPFRVNYQSLNLDKIVKLIDAGRLGETISLEDLVINGIIHKYDRVKLLGTGEIDKKIDIEVHASSRSAKEKVEAAGGSVKEVSQV